MGLTYSRHANVSSALYTVWTPVLPSPACTCCHLIHKFTQLLVRLRNETDTNTYCYVLVTHDVKLVEWGSAIPNDIETHDLTLAQAWSKRWTLGSAASPVYARNIGFIFLITSVHHTTRVQGWAKMELRFREIVKQSRNTVGHILLNFVLSPPYQTNIKPRNPV